MKKSFGNYTIRQLDITDCGVACLASILSFYGCEKPVSAIRFDAGTDQNGTSLLGLVKAAEKYGLKTNPVRVTDRIILQEDLPAIAHLNINKSWFHFVVVFDAGSEEYQVMDPALGKITRLKKAEFNKHWTGIMLLLKPGDSFIKCRESFSVNKRILQIIRTQLNAIIYTILAALLYSGLGISTALYIEHISDILIPAGELRQLNLISSAVVLIIFLRSLTGYLKNLIILKTSKRIDGMLINNYNQHLLELPVKFFQSMKTGEIMNRINDAIKIRSFINTVSFEWFVNLMIVIITFSLMFNYSWKLSLILSSSIPLFILKNTPLL